MSLCQGFSHLRNSYSNAGVMSLRRTLRVDVSVDLKSKFYFPQRFHFLDGWSTICPPKPSFSIRVNWGYD